MATKKLTKVITPVGELHYVNIEGQGKECYDAEKGHEYVATLYLSTEASADLRKKMDDEIGEIGPKETLKSTGYRQLMEDSEGKIFTPTKKKKDGTLVEMYAFVFRTGTKFADGKIKKIKVFDVTPKEVNLNRKKVGNGSLGAISGNMERSVYKGEVSCSLYLNAIQLTKFIEYSDDAGFGAQEGEFDGLKDEETGFVGSPAEPEDDIPDNFEKKPKSKPRL